MAVALIGKEEAVWKNLIAVGRKTDGAAEGSKTVLGDRANNAPEPVCFWSLPQEWYDVLIHSFFVKLIVGLTPTPP